MMLLLTGRSSSYAQLITVLIIFCIVLGVTAWVTKWMANYQKQQNVNCNVEIKETTRISSSKYIQLVRVGDTYFAIAVCKDTVTLLGEIPAEQLKNTPVSQSEFDFHGLLQKALKKVEGSKEPKE